MKTIIEFILCLLRGRPAETFDPPPPAPTATPTPRPSSATADSFVRPKADADFILLLGVRNVQAFLRVIRAGETHPTNDEAYRALFGWRPGNGQTFAGFDDHPRVAIMSPWGWTSAAGAYQAMCAVPGMVKTDTWGDFIRSHGPRDFSPLSQDIFAVWCIGRRGALADVVAGRLEVAIGRCAKEWASLPGSPYGQPVKTMDQCRKVYLAHGGTLAAGG